MLSDVGRLRTLRKIAEHGSFSRAADELGYTQSAISQQIAALEQEVQLTLLNRAVRPVALTDAGRVLVEHTEPMLRQIAAAEAQLDALRGLRAGRLRAAAFGSAFATFLPAVIADFRRRHPSRGARRGRGRARSSASRCCGPARSTSRWSTASPMTWRRRSSVRGDAPARRRTPRRPAGASPARRPQDALDRRPRRRGLDRPLGDGPARGYRGELERLWADAGFAPRIAFQTDDLQAAQAFVAARLGVALMHDLTLPTRREGVVIRPLTGPRLARPVSAVVATRSPVTAGDGDDGDPGCAASF